MAKASINLTCSVCGTSFWHEKICQNRASADSYESWAEENITTCPACFAIAKREAEARKRAEKRAKDAEAVKDCPVPFPALEGTEKQVTWATDIRTAWLAEACNRKMQWDKLLACEIPEIKADVEKMLSPSAKTWIDLRFKRLCGINVGLEG